MRVAEQLALFLENRPGRLAEACLLLAKERINILALSVSDTVDHGVVRLVLSDPRRAARAFSAEKIPLLTTKVVFLELDNRVGILGEIADKLATERINIEYIYATATDKQKTGCVVLRTAEPERTLQVLAAHFNGHAPREVSAKRKA
mgnify:CR=1 FL=1